MFLLPFSYFLVFLVLQKHTKPCAGVRKQKKTRGSGPTSLYFWRQFTSFERLWRKRCSPATDPKGSDQGPGERVGRGVILLELLLNHLLAQRAGGIEKVVCFEKTSAAPIAPHIGNFHWEFELRCKTLSLSTFGPSAKI